MTTLARKFLVLAMLLGPMPALAQQTTGSVIGRVTDDGDVAIVEGESMPRDSGPPAPARSPGSRPAP